MKQQNLSKERIRTAYAIAVLADLIQFPITASIFTGVLFIPAEMFDFVMDCAVMCVVTFLIGFHWALLPSLLLEIIPFVNLFPTWTGSVAFAHWQKNKHLKPSAVQSSIVVQEAQIITDVPPRLLRHVSTAQPSRDPRLAMLNDLLQRKAITHDEYEIQRQQFSP